LSTDWVQPIFQKWRDRLKVNFYGVTSDGTKKENLYPLQDEGAPIGQMVSPKLPIFSALIESLKTLDGSCKARARFMDDI
jgi:hypothetical protein